VVFVFLSYAEEDREIAAEISAWLAEQGVDRFDWLTNGSGRFLPLIEGAISRADAFLALMSPHFLASKWCSRERDMALFREQELQEDEPDRAFVHVLEAGTVRPETAGFLGSYNWLSFTSPTARDAAFDELGRRLGLSRNQPSAGSSALAGARPQGPSGGPPDHGQLMNGAFTLPPFRNRERELDLIEAGLVSGEKPFWLVTAPPQLGKSWFLKRARTRLEGLPTAWTTSTVDVRNLPRAMREDPGALIAKFFGRANPVSAAGPELRGVAKDILTGGRPWVCLLDHAELLDKAMVASVRAMLSQIYQEVQTGKRRSVRLGLIVASRRESEWLGVTPRPRVSGLPLSEFRPDVVQEALLELAEEIHRDHSESEARNDTALVYELTQGLPALLAACLEWIQDDGWFDLEELRTPELFKRLAYPYIDSELLTRESLQPRTGGPRPADYGSAEAISAVREAYRVLSPFRLFTRSHVHHYLGSDREFRAAVAAPHWTDEDLWAAVSDTALVGRLRGLWKVIHPAVRRLLYRYYYPSDDACRSAHEKAREIVHSWTVRQSGIEQATFLVECLWHEAMALRLAPDADLRYRLTTSAGALSRLFRGSDSHTDSDLREYAAEQMGDDAELQQTLSRAPGLFDRLIEIVRDPPPEQPPPPGPAPRTPPKEPA
jgi:hypothetical protein